MNSKFRGSVIALPLALSLVVPAYAQSGGQTMPGMDMQKQTMPGMDMQKMMNQCAQMRGQMKSGSRLTPDMQRMMAQCDQMDAQTNTAPGNPPESRTRNR